MRPEYDIPFIHLKNNQNISAHNEFMNFAQDATKEEPVKSAILYLLAAECRAKQGKDNDDEILQAGNVFLSYAKKQKNYNSKIGFLCASKCFLKVGKIDDAKKAYAKSQEFFAPNIEVSRPVLIIDDSKAITMKLQNYVEKLGYKETLLAHNGKEGIAGHQKLIKNSKSPIVLLDMSLPDMGGDEIASKILSQKPDSQIIVITADEKSTKRVNKTISSGVSAFIQKPFTIDEVKRSLELVESEFSML